MVQRKRGRSGGLRILATLAGVLVGLLAAEIGLRLWDAASRRETDANLRGSDPLESPPPVREDCATQIEQARLRDIIRPSEHADLIYELRPGTHTCFHGNEVRINTGGLRDARELARPKPGNVYRVLLLGDSHTFGWGVDWEDTPGEQLERLLEPSTDLEVEVVNAGVPGFNTAQEAAYLEHRGLDLEPDCVVVLFLGNDLGLPTFLLEPEEPPRLGRSRLLDLVRRSRGPRSWFVRAEPELTDFVHAVDLERVPAAYRHMVGLAGYRRAWRRMGRLAARAGIPVANAADYSSHGGVAQRREPLSKLMQKLGVFGIELAWPSDEALRVSREDPHLNAAGQGVYVRRLLDGLTAAGVCLPPGPSGG